MDYITKTQDEIAGDELLQIQSLRDQGVINFIGSAQEAYDSFWFKGLHPSIKAKRLGANAVIMFTESAQVQAFIKVLKPDHIELSVPTQFQVNWNADGSCEIVDVPLVTPPQDTTPVPDVIPTPDVISPTN